MPRAYLMSWEGHPHYRWVKMYKGIRYRVSCRELGATVCTKEGSAPLANAWWSKRRAELDGVPARVEVFQRVLEGRDELSLLSRAVAELLQDRDRLKNELLAFAARVADDQGDESFHRVIAQSQEADELRLLSTPSATSIQRTLQHQIERFLTVVAGEMKPKSFSELRYFLRSLYTVPLLGADFDVQALDEAKIEEVYLWLKLADIVPPTRKKRWGFFRRFVRYLWSTRLIELPRNLETFAFKVPARAIKTFPLEQVRQTVAGMKSRLRLYALLGLNCGMTQVDIGLLRKEQVDLVAGRLTRKRVKTELCDNVPTVHYKLWPPTLALLREHWSADATLALTSVDGTPLWRIRQEADGSTPMCDLISQTFRRARAPITLKHFRSISATLIESHEHFGRYVSHFLGHSPQSIQDRHYAAPSAELFDRVMDWLYGQLFPPGQSLTL